MDERIFKGNDIRGLYPREINEKNVKLISEAFVCFLKKRKNKILNIAIGMDNRPSSPKLYNAIRKSLLSAGVNVFSLSKIATPAFYFFCRENKIDGGIQVTASHNPIKFNGLKFVWEKAEPIGIDNGLDKIKIITKSELGRKKAVEKTGKEIIVSAKEIAALYSKFCLKKIKPTNKNLKIIIDCRNSVPAITAKEIRKISPFQIILINQKLGNGLKEPNPFAKSATKDLSKKIKEEKADFGVIFDGDGDRIIFLDNKGKLIGNEIISSIIAEEILAEKKGEKVIVSMASSWEVKEAVEKAGNKIIFWKTGHSYIKKKMKKEKAIFASEVSGHYFFKAAGYLESPLMALFIVANKISAENKKISEIRKKYEKYCYSGQINIRAKKGEEKIKLIKKIFSKKKNAKITMIDGFKAEFKDWWFILRKSKTENLIRLTVEAKTKEKMKEKIKYIMAIIK